MAWLTREDARHSSRLPKEPDMDTLTYWVKRLEPLIRAEGDDEIIVIFANRTGTEEEAVYAGTSAVIGIKSGEVSVYGLLGRGEKELLVVDTDAPPFAQLVYRPGEGTVVDSDAGNASGALPVQEATDTQTPEFKSPGPGSFSTGSKPSSPSKNQQVKTKSVEGPPGVDGGDFRYVVDGDTSTTQGSATPLTRLVTPTHFEKSPDSARFFWISPDELDIPRIPQSPTLSTRSNYAESPVETRTVAGRGREVKEPPNMTTRNGTVASQNPAFSVQTGASRGDRPAHVSADTTPAGRAHSPRPRKGSRAGRRERSDSNIAHAELQDADPERQLAMSPDLEKLGADMLVFDEGPRRRRDSLECHVDEDDFVVFHVSRKEQVKPYKRERTPSVKGHKHVRNKSIDPEKRGPEHSSPRHQHTPRLDSPASGDYQPHPDKASSRAKGSPQLSDSRVTGRDEQRGGKQPPQRESPRSPQHSSPRLTSPRSRGTGPESNQASPTSQYKNPGAITKENLQSWNDQQNQKSGSHRGFERDEDVTRANNKADKPRVLPDGSAGVYASSDKTVQKSNSHVTIAGGPKTPKPMRLVPDTSDEKTLLPATNTTRVETIPLKCVVKVETDGGERPKSVVW